MRPLDYLIHTPLSRPPVWIAPVAFLWEVTIPSALLAHRPATTRFTASAVRARVCGSLASYWPRSVYTDAITRKLRHARHSQRT